MRFLAATLALALLTPAVQAAVPAPRIKAQSFEQLAKPLPLPYDANANGVAAVAKARARARASGKLLLVDLGGNWCLDCRVLAGTIELPELKAWVRRHYEVVTVDTGRHDKNLEVQTRYGLGDAKAVPNLLVIDPKTDTLINAGSTVALSDARSMNPQGLADYLAKWVR
jgi:thiol-disulfide isomerase/thioredoxin